MRKSFWVLAIALSSCSLMACQAEQIDTTPQSSPPAESTGTKANAAPPAQLAANPATKKLNPTPPAETTAPNNGDRSQDIYVNANYTVTIRGFGGDASYEGCNAQEQCLQIDAAATVNQGQYIWEKDGYTYSMTPLEATSGEYRLTVLDRTQKAIVKEILTPFADYQGCLATAPANFVRLLGENRLAQSADFIPEFQKSCKLLKLDFNNDQLADYAFFSIAPKTPNTFYLNFAVSLADGSYDSMRYDYTNKLSIKPSGIIYTAIALKPAGKLGIADRDYSPLTPAEKKVYQAATSVEFFGTLSATGTGEEPTNYDPDTLMYCSTAQYFVNNQAKSFDVCD